MKPKDYTVITLLKNKIMDYIEETSYNKSELKKWLG